MPHHALPRPLRSFDAELAPAIEATFATAAAHPGSALPPDTHLPLHPRQRLAHESPATEILFGGAAGGGKSHLLRVTAIRWCLRVPGLQCYLFRRQSSDLQKNHMEGPHAFPNLLAPYAAAGLARIRHGGSRIDFSNGARIFLCHCQYEKDRFRYQGTEMHLLLVDELTHFTADIYRYLRGRVRLGGLAVPEPHARLLPRVICASNPGGVGHNWVKADFVDMAEAGAVTPMPPDQGGMLRQYLTAKIDDNPTLLQSDPGYLARLEGLGDPALVRAMRLGDWDIVSGGAFDDVWRREAHVLPCFAVPPSWRLDRSFDWGSSRPFSVGWWAESDGTPCEIDGTQRFFPRGTLVRVAEYYGWNGRPNEGCRLPALEVARRIREMEQRLFAGRRVLPGPADAAIYAVENGSGIAEDMLRAGVDWTKADKRPGSRKSGLEALRARLKAVLEHPNEEPGLYVCANCTHFIRTVPVLPRDPDDPDDVNSRAEDHVYDDVRYRVMTRKSFVRAD